MAVNQPSASSFKQVVTLREVAPFCLSIAALSQHDVGRHCATLWQQRSSRVVAEPPPSTLRGSLSTPANSLHTIHFIRLRVFWGFKV